MRNTVTILTAAALCWIVSGCAMAPRSEGAQHLRTTALADDNGNRVRNAVENAREWSKKYALLADECLKNQKERTTLIEDRRKLTDKAAKLESELAQAKKELGDANAMLGDLNGELTRWKADVLGFREEIRRAQQAQLGLLSKMVVLLGGEVPELTNQADDKLVSKSRE